MKNSFFDKLNPWIATIYYILVIGLIMGTQSPLFLGMALVGAIFLNITRLGLKELKPTIVTALIVMVFATLLNGLFTHNGETVLFYLGSNRITKEAFIFGMVMSLLIVNMILWFKAFSSVMTSDKLIYVFGSFAPVIGLVISMVFRFIPLLKNRFQEIRAGQIALGRDRVKGPIKKLALLTKEISTLISWSLEASIESADSMAGRGYGLKGRTCYRLFRFRTQDYIFAAATIILGALTIWGFITGVGRVFYYPSIRLDEGSATPIIKILSILSFAALLIIPTVAEIKDEYQWQKF